MLRVYTSILKTEYAADVPIQKCIDDGLDVDEILKFVLQGLATSHDCQREGGWKRNHENL